MRPLSGTRPGSSAVSVGKNTLTSPPLGFNVPITAMANRGQNAVTPVKPSPVKNISAAAHSNTRFAPSRRPNSPTPSVSAAEPSSVPVISTPISLGEKPRSER